ncbi:MAG: hypothetical protein AAFO04_27645 [Cyanobacteria bacterium J06592_8]
MRITALNQVAKGLAPTNVETRKSISEDLTSIKWYLWHSNVFRALQRIEYLLDDIALLAESKKNPCSLAKKLYKMMAEFQTYISHNEGIIPNYGGLWRVGETISSSFVESTVNQVISKRFVKKQLRRWTPKGAHLLLQVRTQVLNKEFKQKFQQWYKGLELNQEESLPKLQVV